MGTAPVVSVHGRSCAATEGLAAALGDPRGEFTVVVSGLSGHEAAGAVDLEALAAVARRNGLSDRSTVDLLRAAGVPRREAYRVAQETGKRSVRGR